MMTIKGHHVSLITAGRPLISSSFLVYYVDNDGSCLSGDFFSVGSGSSSAYSVVDAKLQEIQNNLKDFPKEKAIETLLWAVKHATYRDGFSGGYLNVLEVNQTGIFHLQRVDCRNLKIS